MAFCASLISFFFPSFPQDEVISEGYFHEGEAVVSGLKKV